MFRLFLNTTLTILLSQLVWAQGSTPKDSIYNNEVKTITGKTIPFSQYRGKVLLIVNTASECGFTPQLKDLEALHQKYKDKGFEVLAFPSNDFKQELDTASDIHSFAKNNYGSTFTFFDKIKVTGDNKHPVYKYLTSHAPNSLMQGVTWNFEKFLVNKEGSVIGRWKSRTKPLDSEITEKIEEALSK